MRIPSQYMWLLCSGLIFCGDYGAISTVLQKSPWKLKDNAETALSNQRFLGTSKRILENEGLYRRFLMEHLPFLFLILAHFPETSRISRLYVTPFCFLFGVEEWKISGYLGSRCPNVQLQRLLCAYIANRMSLISQKPLE